MRHSSPAIHLYINNRFAAKRKESCYGESKSIRAGVPGNPSQDTTKTIYTPPPSAFPKFPKRQIQNPTLAPIHNNSFDKTT